MILRRIGKIAESLSGNLSKFAEATPTVLRCSIFEGSNEHLQQPKIFYSDSRGEEDAKAPQPEASTGSSSDWTAAMDSGNWDQAWEMFSSQLHKDDRSFPKFEELLAWDPDDEEKEVRRQKELDFQESVARSRVRKVSEQGIAHGVGRRKTSVAQVWIREGIGHCMVNRKPFDMYFADLMRRNDIITPLVVANALGKFDVMALVHGGGSMGQAQAMRHGIARALQNWNPELRGVLKESGLLSRDARIVERKKPGKKKARKSFQWVKR
ncbi:hypothetical protein M9434_003406 [Picochlorum sp. BPE23]|nr:hypothetical protein M9434_003406 [Picochlorum sp. BPE23]